MFGFCFSIRTGTFGGVSEFQCTGQKVKLNMRRITMEKIKMITPLVEMDGDEMTRILWKMIKEELLCPFVDLKTEYYVWGWNIEMRQMTR